MTAGYDITGLGSSGARAILGGNQQSGDRCVTMVQRGAAPTWRKAYDANGTSLYCDFGAWFATRSKNISDWREH